MSGDFGAALEAWHADIEKRMAVEAECARLRSDLAAAREEADGLRARVLKVEADAALYYRKGAEARSALAAARALLLEGRYLAEQVIADQHMDHPRVSTATLALQLRECIDALSMTPEDHR